jgi:hypothetical protein
MSLPSNLINFSRPRCTPSHVVIPRLTLDNLAILRNCDPVLNQKSPVPIKLCKIAGVGAPRSR